MQGEEGILFGLSICGGGAHSRVLASTEFIHEYGRVEIRPLLFFFWLFGTTDCVVEKDIAADIAS